MPLPNPLPDDYGALDSIIEEHEKKDRPLRRHAQAKIYWHKEKQQKTPYSIVYLHGFKSSHPEGAPVHQTIAEDLGCNMYLSRLHGHGQIKTKKFADLTSRKLIDSATDALRVGQQIGEKVIIMATSTGATLALHLAASEKFADSVAALVLYSPLIHLYGIQSLLLENRCSRSLLRFIPGSAYQVRSADPFSPHEKNVWYHSYQLNGALALGETVEQIIKPELFHKITCPTFIGYYYKDAHNHDRVVSTAAIKRVARSFGTPSSNLMVQNFPGARSHVICSSLLSDAVHEVTDATRVFLTRKLNMHPSADTYPTKT